MSITEKRPEVCMISMAPVNEGVQRHNHASLLPPLHQLALSFDIYSVYA